MNALIAFNGSAEAGRAVDWVARAGLAGATVLTVGQSGGIRRGRRRRGRPFSGRPGYALADELRKAVEQLEAAGVSASCAEKTGDVAKTIVGTAAEGHFDLIVVGSRRRHGLRRFLFGSTAEKVVRKASVSVLVVR